MKKHGPELTRRRAQRAFSEADMVICMLSAPSAVGIDDLAAAAGVVQRSAYRYAYRLRDRGLPLRAVRGGFLIRRMK